jgi:hypothetical protein
VCGFVFVADSQEEWLNANLESIDNVEENLTEHGYELNTLPCVLQFNK